MNKAKLGSQTAKGGFKNEDWVCKIFNDWKNQKLAQDWLVAMNYKLDEIENVKAQKISGQYKADIQVTILITIKLKSLQDIQNLQVKLVSNPQGFNQIDKRWLEKYQQMWNIPQNIFEILQYFVGEKEPKISNPRDKRRMFFDEFTEFERELILKFFTENKVLILNDILKGRGKFASEWFLVVLRLKNSKNSVKWTLKPINEVVNFYNGEIEFSPKGSLKIGKITMQRKGGDGGRDSAKMLQFKLNPCELFENL